MRRGGLRHATRFTPLVLLVVEAGGGVDDVEADPEPE